MRRNIKLPTCVSVGIIIFIIAIVIGIIVIAMIMIMITIKVIIITKKGGSAHICVSAIWHGHLRMRTLLFGGCHLMRTL